MGAGIMRMLLSVLMDGIALGTGSTFCLSAKIKQTLLHSLYIIVFIVKFK